MKKRKIQREDFKRDMRDGCLCGIFVGAMIILVALIGYYILKAEIVLYLLSDKL